MRYYKDNYGEHGHTIILANIDSNNYRVVVYDANWGQSMRHTTFRTYLSRVCESNEKMQSTIARYLTPILPTQLRPIYTTKPVFIVIPRISTQIPTLMSAGAVRYAAIFTEANAIRCHNRILLLEGL